MPLPIVHWVAGRSTAGTSGRVAPVFNPATGEQTGAVDLASPAEVDAAVASAVSAASGWRQTSLSRRAAVLFAFRELLHNRSDELAKIVTAEHGKVLADAAGEIARGIENVEFATGVPQLLKGGFSEQVFDGRRRIFDSSALGVVAGITPFNFPVMVPLWMCANAIAVGNAFILKPSEKGPVRIAVPRRPLAAGGLPDGVFTVLQGDKIAVDRLLAHPDIAAVSFVGSTAIAREIYKNGTAQGKRGPGAWRSQEPHGRAS